MEKTKVEQAGTQALEEALRRIEGNPHATLEKGVIRVSDDWEQERDEETGWGQSVP